MNNTFKIGSNMLKRRVSKHDMIQANKRAQLLNYLGITEYYDQPTTTYINEYVSTVYKSIEEYESDKFNARMLIDLNKPIPNELKRKLVTARKELEEHGILEPL